MHYVYVLRSENHDQIYIGQTSDLKSRLDGHNQGKSKHTAKFKPWIVIGYYAFVSKEKAIQFEKYLKTSSGKAFLNKRLV
jgi:predicted GIY-YIG superfamily endonuclease